MDNLNDLYFLSRTPSCGLGSRYTIGQILYEIVSVPEQIREACNLIHRLGVAKKYKPSFYTLKYIERVYTAIPSAKIEDMIHLCNYLGSILSLTRNKKLIGTLEIKPGGNQKEIPKETKHLKTSLTTCKNTGNVFIIIIHILPDYE